ncbi:unnamed protein product [Lactuca saligna]|uniref:Uncharacterized protein n=1 Tax=Lactuca saligna TaxID=75948 RepID=A0AA35YMA8_LACSI|nr:unnamed protein product [Lactuca saligna]
MAPPLEENLDFPLARFSDIPNEALLQMFSRFGTMYRWHSQENENIFDAFKCVVKDRYRDRMKGIRRQSANIARNDGKPLPPNFCSYYDGMHNYRPERVPETVWQRLCHVLRVLGSTIRIWVFMIQLLMVSVSLINKWLSLILCTKASNLLKNLSLDSQAKTTEIPEPTKKVRYFHHMSSMDAGNGLV